MDYKEFEIIHKDLSFHPSENGKKVVFCVNRGDPHGFAEKNRHICQEKYDNMSFANFKKEYDAHLPEFNRRKYRRKVLINDFKSHKTEDFAEMPLNKKLDYLDAFSIDLRSNEEWERDYKDAYDNLVACLWSISPSQEFLAEEREKLNHFMNVLVAGKLVLNPHTNRFETGSMVHFYKNLDLLDKDKKDRTMRIFLDTLSDAYKIDSIPIEYYVPDDPTDSWNGYAPVGEWKMCLRSDRSLGWSMEIMSLLFHESMHLRQDKMYEEDSEKYRIFTPEYGRIKNMIRCFYDRDKYHQIYELDPRESHAYYCQRHFEHAVNDRIFNGCLQPGNYPINLARTLWFDYQR